MKKLIQYLSVLGFLASGLIASADPAPKICVVDMNKLFDGHYKAIAEKAKIDGYGQKARAEFDQMTKDRDALVEQFKELDDQAKNPAASTDAKAKAQGDAQAKYNEIQSKSQEMQQFASEAQRSLQAQMQNFHDMLMQEISKLATDIAKRHGATILVDKSGVLLGTGVPAVLFYDPSYDITDEVAAVIATNRPPETSTPTAPASGTAPAPTPTITVPNVTPAPNG